MSVFFATGGLYRCPSLRRSSIYAVRPSARLSFGGGRARRLFGSRPAVCGSPGCWSRCRGIVDFLRSHRQSDPIDAEGAA